MIHPADERIVVCVKPAVKKKKHGTMSPHGKCTLEDDVTARNLNIPKGPLQEKRAGCPARKSVFIAVYRSINQNYRNGGSIN